MTLRDLTEKARRWFTEQEKLESLRQTKQREELEKSTRRLGQQQERSHE